MIRSFKQIWQRTTENAIWICYAIAMIFSMSGNEQLYMSLITVGGLLLYYYDAITSPSTPSEPFDTDTSDVPTNRASFGLVVRKLWRITEANGIWLAMGISAIYYLEGPLFIYTTIMTIIGFGLFYVYAYQTLEYVPIDFSALPAFSWRTFAKNMWNITESNILTIASSLSLMLYVAGKALVLTTIFVSIGFVLFYIDAYRVYLLPTDDESPEVSPIDDSQSQITTPLVHEE